MGVSLRLRVTFLAVFWYKMTIELLQLRMIEKWSSHKFLLLLLSILDYNVDSVTRDRVQEREREGE